ncbi:MAG: hypothetical protein Q8Q25_00810, partial [bacterium]|nr:hypothetical protein [bacterium]
LNYRRAFDQSAIHKKFAPLLEQWGCAQNVFGQNGTDRAVASNQAQEEVLIDIPEQDSDTQGHELRLLMESSEVPKTVVDQLEEKYKKACLARLQNSRRWALTEDAREAVSTIALLSGAAVTVNSLLPPESMGSSFGIFALLFNTAYLLRPTIRCCWNLAKPPAHPLDALEQQFTQTQCFIPKALWPIITEKFMVARTNQFEQRNAMNFLEFVLGLTTYKQKPALTIDEKKLEQGIKTLFGNIDQFFADYEGIPSENIWVLKNNILKFVRSLRGDQTQAPRYLYLHGVGGIGKTYFIDQLSRWIEEIIPGSVLGENLVISTAEELEGSSNRPGAILRVLRNQLLGNKRGSVVFMDEASWLNKEDMANVAKRVFNGDQSAISTSYFGNGVDGTGIVLKIPPMLICAASNDEIKDPALKTRFDTIKFPTPKRETLVHYAQKIAAQNELVKNKTKKHTEFDFKAWLDRANVRNFRDVSAQIVPAILSASE